MFAMPHNFCTKFSVARERNNSNRTLYANFQIGTKLSIWLINKICCEDMPAASSDVATTRGPRCFAKSSRQKLHEYVSGTSFLISQVLA
jgi:hypothetical protein